MCFPVAETVVLVSRRGTLSSNFNRAFVVEMDFLRKNTSGSKKGNSEAAVKEDDKINEAESSGQKDQPAEKETPSPDTKSKKKKGPTTDRIGTFLMGEKPINWAKPKQRLEWTFQANPKYPPWSLSSFKRFLSDYGEVSLVTLNQTSEDVPYRLKDFLSGPDSEIDSDKDSDFLLKLTWRDGEMDPILTVDTSDQDPIVGEADITRFVLRTLDPAYESPENKATVAENDEWLNLAFHEVMHGGDEERQAAVRKVNRQLGKTPFLLGHHAHLVDMVVLSALMNTVGETTFQDNVENWYQSLVSNDLYL